MNAVVVIPARYASTRLPGKPLLRETGKYLIEHVWERAGRARRVGAVIVATDDARIADAVSGFGGRAVLTSAEHASGTDRVAEAARALDASVVVNVQGDEPEISPDVIDTLVEAVEAGAPMATAAVPSASAEAFASPAVVKVVVDRDGWALYFSRAGVPAGRDAAPERFLKHLGIYAYTGAFLQTFAGLSATPLEETEKLEQLRVLEHGHRIRVCVVDHDSAGIDTIEEYRAFVRAEAWEVVPMAEEDKSGKKVDEDWKDKAERDKAPAEEPAGPAADGPLPDASFGTLVSGFAMQALIAMGEVENPVSGKREPNLPHAKFTIDTLQVLSEKTRGNLDEQEKRQLDGLLYDLRMRYVQASG